MVSESGLSSDNNRSMEKDEGSDLRFVIMVGNGESLTGRLWFQTGSIG